MEFEKQLNRIKKGRSQSGLSRSRERTCTYKSLRVKYFGHHLSLLKIKALNVGRFNMDEVSVQTAVQDAESVPFLETADWL